MTIEDLRIRPLDRAEPRRHVRVRFRAPGAPARPRPAAARPAGTARAASRRLPLRSVPVSWALRAFSATRASPASACGRRTPTFRTRARPAPGSCRPRGRGRPWCAWFRDAARTGGPGAGASRNRSRWRSGAGPRPPGARARAGGRAGDSGRDWWRCGTRDWTGGRRPAVPGAAAVARTRPGPRPAPRPHRAGAGGIAGRPWARNADRRPRRPAPLHPFLSGT